MQRAAKRVSRGGLFVRPRQNFRRDAARLVEDALENGFERFLIERPGIVALREMQNVALAGIVAHRQPCSFFEFAELDGHLGAAIEQPDKFAVQLIDAPSVVVDRHVSTPSLEFPDWRFAASSACLKTKPAADPFGLRPDSVKLSLRLLLDSLFSFAHALHRGRFAKGEAVRKGEAKIKSARIGGGSHGVSNRAV
jgi:hypothetical protein